MAETWLKPSISDGELLIPHYKLFRKDRAGRGGGAGFYCHESLAIRRRSDLESTDLELIWIDVGSGEHTCRVGCGYRPPNMSRAYWDLLARNLETAQEGYPRSTVLIGDFNVDFTPPLRADAGCLRDITAALSLSNCVTSPTRVTSQSQSMIDLFFTNIPIQGHCETLFLDISDHHAILARIVSSTSARFARGTSSVKGRRLHQIDWDNFRPELDMALTEGFDTQNIELMVSSLNKTVTAVLDKHAPITVRHKKERRPCPWLTDNLVQCVRDRKRLHRLLMRDTTNDVLRQQHRTARAMARSLDRKLRNQYFMSQCSTSDQRKLWSVMNTVTGRKRSHSAPQVPPDQLSDVFGDVVNDPTRLNLKLPTGPMSSSAFTVFDPVTLADVTKCLVCVDPMKAMGSDGIPGIVLKNCARNLSPFLLQIINTSLANGTVPSLYKVSHISPLFKNGDPSLARNYRPVSLLPVVSRILEHFVKTQLTKFLHDLSLLPPSQFAYRKSHSTEDALVLATNRWLLAKSERKHTGVIMVDMSKAFDRVQHGRLIQVLFEYGIGHIPLLWFCSYLTDRRQIVRVKDVFSKSVECSRGVPQGSVLGPLLFVLYTSQMSSILPAAVFHQEFADDIIVDFSHCNPATVCSALTDAVTCLSEWLTSIGLFLNASKTQVMFIRPRGCVAGPSEVRCGTALLDTTNVSKYLGVLIDDKLSWKPHVQHLAKKTTKTVGQLWRHGRCLSLRARRLWYQSMIQSQLCYASSCFYPALTKELREQVIRMSKAGIRSIFRVNQRTPTAPLLNRLSLPSLHQVFLQRLLIVIFRSLHGMTSTLLEPLFTVLAPGEGTITRGQTNLLLLVPFLPGPSGRSCICFAGSLLWNRLPAAVRVLPIASFKSSVSNIDLVDLHI